MAETASSLQIETARAIVTWMLQNELLPGSHLREHQLASALLLSRSPIRGALNLLSRHGIVEQQPHRGYFLAVSMQELGAREALLPASGDDELYRIIAHAWFNGDVADPASTAELRRRFAGNGQDVGRALKRLHGDGIIMRLPGNGWRLGPNLATEGAFLESYAFRQTIEPAALLLASFRLDRSLASLSRRRHAAILRTCSDASVKDMVDADLEFHHLIAVSSHNQFFAQAIVRQNALRRLTEMITTPESARLRQSSAEHVAILDALESGDRDGAARCLREHLTMSSKFTPQYIAGSRQSDGVTQA